MPHPGRVTVYIVGVTHLSCLVALSGVRTCDVPKISNKTREVNRVGRSYQPIKKKTNDNVSKFIMSELKVTRSGVRTCTCFKIVLFKEGTAGSVMQVVRFSLQFLL